MVFCIRSDEELAPEASFRSISFRFSCNLTVMGYYILVVSFSSASSVFLGRNLSCGKCSEQGYKSTEDVLRFLAKVLTLMNVKRGL